MWTGTGLDAEVPFALEREQLLLKRATTIAAANRNGDRTRTLRGNDSAVLGTPVQSFGMVSVAVAFRLPTEKIGQNRSLLYAATAMLNISEAFDQV